MIQTIERCSQCVRYMYQGGLRSRLVRETFVSMSDKRLGTRSIPAAGFEPAGILAWKH